MVKSTTFQRGDIITVCLDPTVGNELQGRNRPVLVLSSNEFHKRGLMMIAPITQGHAELARDNGFAITLNGTGCKTQGVIVANQQRIIDFTKRNAQKIESVPDYIIYEAQDIIKSILED
ncbi:type II toxin-antitoxin system PemK/MazF family toxin [Volucribacter amazonae]|uniref:Growth inhibitor PemK n=1 Tax=Volucribacter amazonae TaxID=256731 RepID=A0A9X4PC18_9PAST|nr:type II toxin-antitoxin system PemK/MazF family toxin [Volucribacter amazonae]MDG6896405.1 growth inhibitor PemK [Volucribacter amazonae]